jgi:hypothetical protein
MEQFVGIDWATRRARWCAVTRAGAPIDEGWAPADEDGLASMVARLGPDAVACLEMMSGAAWVRDRLQEGGWAVQAADARKAKAVGSLAAKTDKLDARVLAELARLWAEGPHREALEVRVDDAALGRDRSRPAGTWRPNNAWHQLYLDVKQRCGGKGNPAKAAVARKVLIATWHVRALQQPFNPSRPR